MKFPELNNKTKTLKLNSKRSISFNNESDIELNKLRRRIKMIKNFDQMLLNGFFTVGSKKEYTLFLSLTPKVAL